MAEDILTVMWKESKSLLRYSSSRWKGLVTLLTPIAIFGIIFPIQFRESWLTSAWPIAISVITPLLLIASTISESFAGERERHTLETLLAYNILDAVNLEMLMVKAYNMKLRDTPFFQTQRLSLPSPVENLFEPDCAIVKKLLDFKEMRFS